MTPTSAQDVVAVLAADFSQVFRDARAIKASVGRTSKAMEHPLETGATIIDHRIINPNTVDLSMVIARANYKAVYQQIENLFRRGELLTVQTRVSSFSNMLIEKMPHEETAEVFDGITIALGLKEARLVQAQFSALPPAKVARPKDSDTAKRGQQQPTESERKGSVLSGFFK